MVRWLVRFGYDGANFAGWARQPGRRTVEGEILAALRRPGLRAVASGPSVAVASRTDRGVSARANALTLDASLTGPALLRALNGIAPDLRFTAAAPVPADFRVRRALRRTYRYYHVGPVRDVNAWRAAAGTLVGEVDVRSFGRGLPASGPVRRRVESVEVSPFPGGLAVEVTAPSFVWGMVRKVVAALREVDAGRLPVGRLAAAARGEARLTLPMAGPEPLVLWAVDHGVAWTCRSPGLTRHQCRYAAGERNRLASRAPVLDAVFPAPSPESEDRR